MRLAVNKNGRSVSLEVVALLLRHTHATAYLRIDVIPILGVVWASKSQMQWHLRSLLVRQRRTTTSESTRCHPSCCPSSTFPPVRAHRHLPCTMQDAIYSWTVGMHPSARLSYDRRAAHICCTCAESWCSTHATHIVCSIVCAGIVASSGVRVAGAVY